MQTKQLHVIPHTLLFPTSFYSCSDPSPTPPPTLPQADTQSSTLLRSRCPNHLNRLTTSATQLIPRRMHKSSPAPSVLQGHLTHPSHHHTFCLFQTSQIISLHCPGFSSIYQNTVDTSTIDPSSDTIRCTTHSQNRRKLLKLGPSTSHSSSSRFHYTSTRT